MTMLDNAGGSHDLRQDDFDSKFYNRVAQICDRPQHHRTFKEEGLVLLWRLYQIFHIPIYWMFPPMRLTFDNRLALHDMMLQSLYQTDAVLLYGYDDQGNVEYDMIEELRNTGDYTQAELDNIETTLTKRAVDTRNRILKSRDKYSAHFLDTEDTTFVDKITLSEDTYDEFDQ